MNSFITGSHAYGEPTPESDVDMVILANAKTRRVLKDHKDKTKGPRKKQIYFGKLNLIICKDEDEFALWLQGTNELIAKASEKGPISREEAKQHFDKLRKRVSQQDNY